MEKYRDEITFCALGIVGMITVMIFGVVLRFFGIDELVLSGTVMPKIDTRYSIMILAIWKTMDYILIYGGILIDKSKWYMIFIYSLLTVFLSGFIGSQILMFVFELSLIMTVSYFAGKKSVVVIRRAEILISLMTVYHVLIMVARLSFSLTIKFNPSNILGLTLDLKLFLIVFLLLFYLTNKIRKNGELV